MANDPCRSCGAVIEAKELSDEWSRRATATPAQVRVADWRVRCTGTCVGENPWLPRSWTLKLTDIVPFPDTIPPRASFTRADLNDGVTMLRLAEGCGTIVHLGGVSVERPFEEVLGPNIRGLYHVYEAARREKARVIFASSNHSIGFHERTETIGADTQFQPDGFYGLSKAYGELMGRMYWA